MSTRHEVHVESLEGLEFSIPCESVRCQAEWFLGSHPADWAALWSCGCMMYLCDARVRHFQIEKGRGSTFFCPRCKSMFVHLTDMLPISKVS